MAHFAGKSPRWCFTPIWPTYNHPPLRTGTPDRLFLLLPPQPHRAYLGLNFTSDRLVGWLFKFITLIIAIKRENLKNVWHFIPFKDYYFLPHVSFSLYFQFDVLLESAFNYLDLISFSSSFPIRCYLCPFDILSHSTFFLSTFCHTPFFVCRHFFTGGVFYFIFCEPMTSIELLPLAPISVFIPLAIVLRHMNPLF